MESTSKIRGGVFGVFLAVLSGPVAVEAATVTTNEAGMDTIFSQASFGPNPIDIRFNDVVTVVGPLNIANAADFTNLYALAPSASPTVNMFFVDTITGPCPRNGNWDGCALVGGNKIAINSSVASGANGAELNAHELGHNLGLAHSDPAVDLMQCCVYGNSTLTAAQVAVILASPLVQGNAGNKFISITPILVTAVAAVPLPAALPLAMSGMSLLGLFGIKRKASVAA